MAGLDGEVTYHSVTSDSGETLLVPDNGGAIIHTGQYDDNASKYLEDAYPIDDRFPPAEVPPLVPPDP